jgi:LysR family hydrogen peroxide-inducible transcriptional activator
MNLQQLEYIVAVDTHRHFVKASEACFVTQATLSMMIKKLEEELDIVIFDRGKHPIEPTEFGSKLIIQARVILAETKKLKESVNDEKKEVQGELKMAVIPTVAPYLLPLFINSFCAKYPKVSLKIHELTTEQIIEKLKRQEIDIGILATPLEQTELIEVPLYYERFLAYAPGSSFKNKKYLLPKDIDVSKLWLLEEGHCLRSQIINLCELRKKELGFGNLHYQAGSIETLIRMAEANSGITIIPELALATLKKSQTNFIYHFKSPEPVREISLVTYKHYYKINILNAIKNEVLQHISTRMKEAKRIEIIDI